VAIADDLQQTVTAAGGRFARVSDADASARRASGAWSAKEILGHLIDSAANNHQRFVRAQQGQGGLLSLPGYAQDDWVRVQGYQGRDWAALVTLWQAFNEHLSHVIRRMPAPAMAQEIRIGDGPVVTLGFVVGDYLTHLQHHVAQIDAQVGAQAGRGRE
jgi:hypothetical protein